MLNKIVEWLFFSRPFDDMRMKLYKRAYEHGRFDQRQIDLEKKMKEIGVKLTYE